MDFHTGKLLLEELPFRHDIDGDEKRVRILLAEVGRELLSVSPSRKGKNGHAK